MERSRSLLLRLPGIAFNFARLSVLSFAVAGLVACDSGTPEPDAPKAEPGEYGAIQKQPTGETAKKVPVKVPRDGSIPAERFPTELPEGVTAEIPPNFPTSIPVYPGAQPALGKGVDRGDGTGTGGVQFVTNDDPGEVFSFYDRELRGNGWDIKDSKNDGVMGTFSVDNGQEQAEIVVMPSPIGGSDIYMVFEGKG